MLIDPVDRVVAHPRRAADRAPPRWPGCWASPRCPTTGRVRAPSRLGEKLEADRRALRLRRGARRAARRRPRRRRGRADRHGRPVGCRQVDPGPAARGHPPAAHRPGDRGRRGPGRAAPGRPARPRRAGDPGAPRVRRARCARTSRWPHPPAPVTTRSGRRWRPSTRCDWVDALPDGLDTVVGSGGRAVTAAQAQQIALARLVLADPHTLVLDEATSLIDPRAARHLERSLAAVLDGRTVIAIAHRLFSAHDADRVAVVEDGVISEFGSPRRAGRRRGLLRRPVGLLERPPAHRLTLRALVTPHRRTRLGRTDPRRIGRTAHRIEGRLRRAGRRRARRPDQVAQPVLHPLPHRPGVDGVEVDAGAPLEAGQRRDPPLQDRPRSGLSKATPGGWWCHSSLVGTTGPVAACTACSRSEKSRRTPGRQLPGAAGHRGPAPRRPGTGGPPRPRPPRARCARSPAPARRRTPDPSAGRGPARPRAGPAAPEVRAVVVDRHELLVQVVERGARRAQPVLEGRDQPGVGVGVVQPAHRADGERDVLLVLVGRQRPPTTRVRRRGSRPSTKCRRATTTSWQPAKKRSPSAGTSASSDHVEPRAEHGGQVVAPAGLREVRREAAPRLAVEPVAVVGPPVVVGHDLEEVRDQPEVGRRCRRAPSAGHRREPSPAVAVADQRARAPAGSPGTGARRRRSAGPRLPGPAAGRAARRRHQRPVRTTRAPSTPGCR